MYSRRSGLRSRLITYAGYVLRRHRQRLIAQAAQASVLAIILQGAKQDRGLQVGHDASLLFFETAPIGVDELDIQAGAEEGESDVGFIERFAWLRRGEHPGALGFQVLHAGSDLFES